jgi:hypothetical protein
LRAAAEHAIVGRKLFDPSERSAVERVLSDLCPISSPGESERVHCAALRLSRGDLAELAKIAKWDWRDILMGAGFGDDVHAHERWVPRLLTSEVISTWENGGTLDDVRFGRRQPAQLYRGEHLPGDPCTVMSLEELEPEPLYTVLCGTGETITVPQSWLRPETR